MSCIRDICSRFEQIEREAIPDPCVRGNWLPLLLAALPDSLARLARGCRSPTGEAPAMGASRRISCVNDAKLKPVVRTVLLPAIAGDADADRLRTGFARKDAENRGDVKPSPGAGCQAPARRSLRCLRGQPQASRVSGGSPRTLTFFRAYQSLATGRWIRRWRRALQAYFRRAPKPLRCQWR